MATSHSLSTHHNHSPCFSYFSSSASAFSSAASAVFVNRYSSSFCSSSKSCNLSHSKCRREISSVLNSKVEIVSQKKGHGKLKNERNPRRDADRKDILFSERETYETSIGLEMPNKKTYLGEETHDQIFERQDLKAASYLNAVVKVYCTHTEPDYSLPWQKQRQYTSTGSAFMIQGKKLLTNAHCVANNTQVKVKRRGDDTKYVATVLATGLECDIALLSVENEEFWEGTEPLKFGPLPFLQDAVTVVGYPLGGDTISVTKGVVSRIEVTSYSHGAIDLLGIQIDAAVNPGNSGGPAFSDNGECIGIAFQVYRSEDAENIGYVIPASVVSHFLTDYERNGKYTGFPCLGVLLQKLENPDLKACLNVSSNEGVLIRAVEPTSPASKVLKVGDVITSFDGIPVANEGTVPFRTRERISFGYLISQKYTGETAELGIVREGKRMNIVTTLVPRVHLVPLHINGEQPSYLIVAGLVFTLLSEPLIDEESEDAMGLKLLAKARYSLAQFEGEEIVILSQVLASEVGVGYETMYNQQVLKFNGCKIKNIKHLAYLVDSCKDKYLVFEFEDNYLVVLEREKSLAATPKILKDYGIASERSPDLRGPCVNLSEGIDYDNKKSVETPVLNADISFDGLLWA
eukprot:TRINITY_DN11057_c0_g1_i1.p1 TRINITY_DN11057_c0_g1~~TRINITY_DN11057_c0_g1_i1.p1  ORF type:complete len:660 (-),score=130.37 TRINITY_DN11057_c0_g1_i1:841-2736(-)